MIAVINSCIFCRLLRKESWFIEEKSCKILSLIVRWESSYFLHCPLCNCGHCIMYLISSFSGRPKAHGNTSASDSKKEITAADDVLKGLVEWLCTQVCTSSSHYYLFSFYKCEMSFSCDYWSCIYQLGIRNKYFKLHIYLQTAVDICTRSTSYKCILRKTGFSENKACEHRSKKLVLRLYRL